METLAANLSGKTRTEAIHGRPFVVAPVSLLVSGVLNGSQGPLYYPPEEVNRDPEAWNGVPLVVGHPKRDGLPVSARDPAVANEYEVGRVYFARAENGRLSGEAWFDLEATRRVDPRVLNMLQAGKQINVSTGLFTDNAPAPPNANHEGKAYSFVATNYRPDHLAILPDEIGACSVRDGCGVLVNAAYPETCPECGGRVGEDGKCEACGYQAEPAENCGGLMTEQPQSFLYRLLSWLFGWGDQMEVNGWFSSCPRDAAGHCSSKGGGGGGGGAGKSQDHKNAGARAKEASGAAKAAGGGTHAPESAHAAAASAKASASGSKADHVTAAKAHDAAWKHHDSMSRRGSPGQQAKHAAAASAHLRAGQAHELAAKRANNQRTTMNRQQTIQYLTANCSCFKGKANAAKQLAALDDDQLAALKANTERDRKLSLVVNAVRGGKFRLNAEGDPEEGGGVSITDVADVFGVTSDPSVDPVAFTKELKAAVEDFLAKLAGDEMPAETEEAVPPPEPGAVVMSSANPTGNRLTQQEREMLAFAGAEMVKQKQALVQRLVGNVADDSRRQARAKTLMAKPLSELQELAELLPEPVTNDAAHFTPSYFGAAGGPASAPKDDSQNLLPVFNIDFEEMASEKLRQKRA